MAEFIRKVLFAIFKKESKAGSLIDRFITEEILNYLIFGVCTTAVNIITYSVLIRLMPGKVTVCNAISWIVAVLFAFITNKLFVFKSKSFSPPVFFKEFSTFMASRILTGLMETFLPAQLIRAGFDMELFGTEGLPAKLVVGIAIIILNYVFSKLISFRKKKPETASPEASADDNNEEE